MSDEHREIEVVSVGSGPLKPGRPRRDGKQVLLVLLVVGVFLTAACSAFTAWTVYDQAQDNRELNCAFLTANEGGPREYDDLEPYEQQVVDAMDCDVEGR